jgi:hypothetical protein
MKHIFRLFILCSISFLSFNAYGQDPTVRAELCSDTIMVGHQFTLTYIVDGGQVNSLSDPDLTAFNLLSGPNTSSSMSFINGQMSAKSSVNFVLQARVPGDYIIEPATLTIDGEQVEVEPLNIHVIENPDGVTLEDLMPDTSIKRKAKKKTKTYKL